MCVTFLSSPVSYAHCVKCCLPLCMRDLSALNRVLCPLSHCPLSIFLCFHKQIPVRTQAHLFPQSHSHCCPLPYIRGSLAPVVTLPLSFFWAGSFAHLLLAPYLKKSSKLSKPYKYNIVVIIRRFIPNISKGQTQGLCHFDNFRLTKQGQLANNASSSVLFIFSIFFIIFSLFVYLL